MKHLILAIISTNLLVACASSSAPRYDNTQEKNVTINVNMDERGGLFSTVEVVAGVNDLDNNCNINYRGFVELSHGKNQIGLTPGANTYLNIEVAFGSRTSSSSFARGTILKPARGRQYEVDVKYIDSMYDFRLYEVSGSKRKPLEVVPMEHCRTST